MITTLTKENFQKEVMESDKTVLIDFWAPWCGYCTQLSPTIDEIAAENEGKLKVCKINIDDEPELAGKFGVMSIPVCLKIESGEIKAKTLGAYPKAELIQQLGL